MTEEQKAIRRAQILNQIASINSQIASCNNEITECNIKIEEDEQKLIDFENYKNQISNIGSSSEGASEYTGSAYAPLNSGYYLDNGDTLDRGRINKAKNSLGTISGCVNSIISIIEEKTEEVKKEITHYKITVNTLKSRIISLQATLSSLYAELNSLG